MAEINEVPSQIKSIIKHVPKNWAKIISPTMGLTPHTLRSYSRGRGPLKEQIKLRNKLIKLYEKQIKAVNEINLPVLNTIEHNPNDRFTNQQLTGINKNLFNPAFDKTASC